MNELLLTVDECCKVTSLGRTKFYQLVARGEIPVRKIGKKTLVATADLKRWTDSLPTMETRAVNHNQPVAA